MLFKFKSRACADLIMLEADARRILQAMTGDDAAQGIVRVADMPAALARLETAVAQDEALHKASAQAAAREGRHATDKDPEQAELPAIRLAQRAAPMLQMLRRCMAEEADLLWGV